MLLGLALSNWLIWLVMVVFVVYFIVAERMNRKEDEREER